MMDASQIVGRNADLEYIANVLAPSSKNREQIMRAMREDPDLLDAMLSDEKLFHHMMDAPSHILVISSWLFFSVLLTRAREDLRKHTFTFERGDRYGVIVFDTAEVVRLLDDRAVRDYLVDMLSSFVRNETTTQYVRVGPGVFERVTVDDFDIESLIAYGRKAGHDGRLLSYKRVGDICLFLLGVFADYVEMQQLLPGSWYRAKSKKELAECGAYYYREARKHVHAGNHLLGYALNRLSAEFLTAVKPLLYLSSRYLGFVRRTVFLQ